MVLGKIGLFWASAWWFGGLRGAHMVWEGTYIHPREGRVQSTKYVRFILSLTMNNSARKNRDFLGICMVVWGSERGPHGLRGYLYSSQRREGLVDTI